MADMTPDDMCLYIYVTHTEGFSRMFVSMLELGLNNSFVLLVSLIYHNGMMLSFWVTSHSPHKHQDDRCLCRNDYRIGEAYRRWNCMKRYRLVRLLHLSPPCRHKQPPRSFSCRNKRLQLELRKNHRGQHGRFFHNGGGDT